MRGLMRDDYDKDDVLSVIGVLSQEYDITYGDLAKETGYTVDFVCDYLSGMGNKCGRSRKRTAERLLFGIRSIATRRA
jgi:hypothetical protein